MTLSFSCFTKFITNDDIKTCKICKHYNVIRWVCSKVVKHGSKHLTCVSNGQDCLYSSNLKVELRCKATTTLACPPEPSSNSETATASSTQRFVPGWKTTSGSSNGTAIVSSTQRFVPGWQTRSGNNNRTATASSTQRPVPSWQTRSGSNSGIATVSSMQRLVPG